MGRPPRGWPASKKTIWLPDELWEAISEFRHAARIPSETEAVKRLIQAGLDALKWQTEGGADD